MAAGKTAVLGHTGFVGSYIAEFLRDFEGFNSGNFLSIAGRSFDTVYCACLPAVKWKANAQPEADTAALTKIKEVLSTVKCREFYLISTIDVHSSALQGQVEEEISQDFSKSGGKFLPALEPYGKHRYDFERWALSAFPGARVLRLPALFGFGLKKNALYDLLHRNQVEKLHPADSFQWYDLRWLADDLRWLASRPPGSILNAYSDPVSTGKIAANFFPATLSLCRAQRPPLSYRQSTLYPQRWRDGETVMRALGEFVAAFRASRALPPGALAASSLHWEPREDERAAAILKKRGLVAVELVPGRYFDWNAPRQEIFSRCASLRLFWQEKGFTISSIQGIMYGLSPSDFEGSSRRLNLAGEVASALGAGAIVFGAPDYRKEAGALASLLSTYQGSVPLCVENVARVYGAAVGTTPGEAGEIVSAARALSPSCQIFVNFDWGNAFAEGWAGAPLPPSVRHRQMSAPGLGPVGPVLGAEEKKYPAFISSPSGVCTSLEARGEVLSLAQDVFSFLGWVAEGLEKEKGENLPTLVLGAGWYGCHAARALKDKGKEVVLYDPSPGFFQGSSSKNQNRLHLGFHYPRSAKTRRESSLGFELFLAAYPHLSSPIRNYYFISRKSLLDYETFTTIFRGEGIKFSTLSMEDEHISPLSLAPAKFEQGSQILSVGERFIRFDSAGEHFSSLLGSCRLPEPPPDESVGSVLDCTFGSLLPSAELEEEQVLTLLVSLQAPVEPFAVTVMDGAFFSLYPYKIGTEDNLYTVTHVSLGVLSGAKRIEAADFCDCNDSQGKRRKEWSGILPAELVARALSIEGDVTSHFPNYQNVFRPAGHYISKKMKHAQIGSDDRSLSVRKEGRVTSFVGGKITGIFSMESYL